MKTIILTGGGTAGHVMPHLALLPELKKHFSNIYYIGSTNGVEKEIIAKNTNLKYFGIDAVKLVRGKILTNVMLPFKLMTAVKQAKKILKELKPNIIFSKGGFVSVPVVMAANSLNIPVVCHESDLSVGLANKICSKHAKCVCTTFEKTAKEIKNGVFSGSPVANVNNKKTNAQIKSSLNIPQNVKVLLITGGSLGSVAINNAIIDALPDITHRFFVIHVTGKGNLKPEIQNKNYLQIEFANNMPDLIQIADIVISRAGSNTIFELAFANKPMLLIPLPKGASRGDQIENANYFESLGFAKVLNQSELNKNTLLNAITATHNEAQTLKQNLKNSGLKNGTPTILEQILKHTN